MAVVQEVWQQRSHTAFARRGRAVFYPLRVPRRAKGMLEGLRVEVVWFLPIEAFLEPDENMRDLLHMYPD